MTERRSQANRREQRLAAVLTALLLGGLLPSVQLSHPLHGEASSSPYSDSVLTDQPLVYYRADESGGSVAADSSGAGRNGTYGAGVTYQVTGATLNDSSNQGVSDATGPISYGGSGLPAGNAARTFEVWFQSSTNTSGNLLANDDFSIGIGNGTANISHATGVGLPFWPADGRWHLLDVTYDGSTLTLYEDGQAASIQAVSPFNTTPTRGLGLGGYPGGYDEMAVYAAALAPSRIEAHWVAASSQPYAACAASPSSAYEQGVVKEALLPYPWVS